MAKGKYTDAEILEIVDKPDITHVANKREDRYYRHANKDPLRIQELERVGFRIEREDDEAKPDSPVAVEDDGTSKGPNLPGMILVSRDKELHDKVIEKKRSRFDDIARMEQEEAIEDVKRDLRKIGVTGKLRRRLESVNRDIKI